MSGTARMIPSRRLALLLTGLALVSLLLGLSAPPLWQALPAAGGALLLALAVLERLGSRWRWPGLWQHPPRPSVTPRAQRHSATLHLLLDRQAPAGRIPWQQDRDQALGFLRSLAAGGNAVRLYGLAPELRLLAASVPGQPLLLPRLTVGNPGELKPALARLCLQASPGSVIVVMTPMAEEMLDGLARLDRARRGLELWLIDTSLRITQEPAQIRGWRSAQGYAEAWQTRLRSDRLAARLERLGIRWLPASDTPDLQTRLRQLWAEQSAGQIAD
ncbi:hypothetical protein RSA46_03440 [Pseudomonas oryzihabitans]|nr:hypothetical protein SB5_22030 [Pseudomonas psychrotolerans]KTT46337.1 hypothetical protein RSA46_03440 [Pseudomonas psychrotolerans]